MLQKLNFRVSDRTHHLISIAVIATISFVGFEALVYINNLFQVRLYILTSLFIYFFLLIWLYFIFDFHFRENFSNTKSLLHAFWKRFEHTFKWDNFRHFQNYLILPGLLYWGTVILIGINFRHQKLQQFLIIATSIALTFAYTFFKEIFKTKLTPIHNTHFIVLTYVKLYASWLVYSAALGIVWYYCLPPHLFYMSVFMFTLMLLWQAAFQFTALSTESIFYILGISFLVALGSSFVFRLWNVNYFSAGVFMTGVYNLLWGFLFHKLKKTLNAEVVIEQVLIFILITVMVLGITNFHARIERCIY